MSIFFAEWSKNIQKLSSASMDYKDYEKKKKRTNTFLPFLSTLFSFLDVVLVAFISIAAVVRSFFFIIV